MVNVQIARGAECITVAVEAGTTLLAAIQASGLSFPFPCGGNGPRDFWPLEDGSIVCACQESGELTLVQQTLEGYETVQRIALPAPVCVIKE